MFFDVFTKGGTYLSFSLFTTTPAENEKGVLQAIVGSFLMVFNASLISIPIGIFLGVFLAENKSSKLAIFARNCVDTLFGIPSIVIGIVAYLCFVLPIGNFSLFSASMALSLLFLPILTKSTEEGVLLISQDIKEAAQALSVPYHKVILKVIIPSCLKNIFSGIILGVARISGETAPLLFTAFGNSFLSFHLFKPIDALPLVIYNYALSPYEQWQNTAWACSLLLILFVLLLSITGRWLIQR